MIHKNSLPSLFLFAALLIFLSFSATACNVYINDDGGSLTVLHEKTFDTSPGKKLTLKAYSGDVIVTTSTDPKVYVKVLGNE